MENNLLWRYLMPLIHLIKENFIYYYFYIDVTVVHFFTKNRIGYWFYFLAVIFSLGDDALSFSQVSFFSPSALFLRAVLGGCMSLAIIKGVSTCREFVEKRLKGESIDNLVKDSLVNLIINPYKPFLFAGFFHMMICITESRQAQAYSKELLYLYGQVSLRLSPLGLKGLLIELQSLLAHPGVCNEFFHFLFYLLLVSIFLHWLEEKERK